MLSVLSYHKSPVTGLVGALDDTATCACLPVAPVGPVILAPVKPVGPVTDEAGPVAPVGPVGPTTVLMNATPLAQ